MAELLLGVDVGTSALKGAIFDARGELLALISRSYSISYPKPHWAEQNPMDYWRAAKGVFRQLVKESSKWSGDIAAVGVAGQTPTAILVDKHGEPLRPAIIWQDARAKDEAEWLRTYVGKENMRKFLGIDLPMEPTWPPARLLWLRRHEARVLRQTYKFLQPKDFINLKLTGEFCSDHWSTKGLVHLRDGTVSTEYASLLGISPDIAPRILRPYDIAGTVSEKSAKEIGLAKGTPVVAGWGDALCAVLATGAFGESGIGFDVTGSSEFVGVSTKRVANASKLIEIPSFITGNVATLYGPTQCGGLSLNWLRQVLSSSTKEEKDHYETLLQSASRIPAGSEGILFLPYLYGERAPIWDSNAKGAFVGLKLLHSANHLMRAVMEGVAYSVRHVLETAESGAGVRCREVRITGGAAQIAIWNQIRADILGRSIQQIKTTESGALGAAMLAAVGAGMVSNLRYASDRMVRFAKLFEPDESASRAYDALFPLYKRLYPSLRKILHSL